MDDQYDRKKKVKENRKRFWNSTPIQYATECSSESGIAGIFIFPIILLFRFIFTKQFLVWFIFYVVMFFLFT